RDWSSDVCSSDLAVQTRRTGGKTKRKRNKSRRVAGQHNNSAKPTLLPCHYAVSFWLDGVVAVRLIFATFLFFFWNGFIYFVYNVVELVPYQMFLHSKIQVFALVCYL